MRNSTNLFNLRNHWGYLALAVLLAYKAIKDAPQSENPDGQSDNWVIYECHFNAIRSSVVKTWEEIVSSRIPSSSQKFINFPWKDDEIKRQWMRYRKRTEKELETYHKQIMRTISQAEAK